ncbi:Protein N-acetyltransferase, RimJ/RimL family [Geodermatophilus telluris]|uniref:Protein N-acetyltransferase, RimJ/RimL family n=1 Tax=Geodermatophilus telluris TaxID=1190417 RepID=A0A1G6UED5_9ACTN|nr:GNAT family N-acetyltransferase [Geodermatophilus telluris]SDD39673.1 Protein N-acetyltransferase, RimJ/RimL family [Geodermatophilus telluris]
MLPGPAVVEAGPVRLRPWRDDDVDDVWAAQQDPAVRLWAGGVASREETVALLARLTGQPNRVSWAVADAGSGAFLGSLTLHSVDVVTNHAQAGYWTAPAARGRGVAARALDAAVRWAFATLPVDRVAVFHAAENAASARVAAKAGFTLEGRLRRSYRYGDGAEHDELVWARLAGDEAPHLG